MFEAIKNATLRTKNNLASFEKNKKEKETSKTAYIDLQYEIHSTNEQIRSAYSNFNYATDNDSISYYTYLIKALEMKYALLLKKAKENNYCV